MWWGREGEGGLWVGGMGGEERKSGGGGEGRQGRYDTLMRDRRVMKCMATSAQNMEILKSRTPDSMTGRPSSISTMRDESETPKDMKTVKAMRDRCAPRLA